MRLLLIEDDSVLGHGLQVFLRADGHAVEWCRTLAEARVLGTAGVDAVLVDWRLPDGSGVDWIRALRRGGDTTPVVMVTARDLLGDRIQGLDAGADDYLVKPFDPEELCARLRALQRRACAAAQARLTFGPVTLDLQARCAYRGASRAELTAREWAVAEALALRADRLVAKSDLEALVLGSHGDVQSNALEVHVSGVRRKLGRDFIQTVRGMGYRVNS